MIYLWSKAELLHDGWEEEEEFSFGKTLSKALPFPCKDHSSSIIYGSLITNQNLSNTIWLKRYPPIENGMRCSSLRTFPSLSRNLSGLNSSPSSQWLPCFYRMDDHWPCINDKVVLLCSLTWQYDFDNGNLEDFSEERKDHCIFWKDHSAHRNVPELNIRHM